MSSPITPLAKNDAAPDVQPVYDSLAQMFGRMPNIFGVMAHRPNALKQFVALFGAVMMEGTVDAKSKELVYLKTSMVNGCEY